MLAPPTSPLAPKAPTPLAKIDRGASSKVASSTKSKSRRRGTARSELVANRPSGLNPGGRGVGIYTGG